MDAIDLHVHSTFSDGTLTPSELISRAKQFHARAVPPPCQVHELRDILDDTNVTDEHDSVTAILEG